MENIKKIVHFNGRNNQNGTFSFRGYETEKKIQIEHFQVEFIQK